MKKILSFIMVFAIGAAVCGCSGDKTSSTTESTDSASQSGTESKELSDDEKKSAKEKGISEDRYCTDAEGIKKISLELFEKYYGGITSLDYDMHSSVFFDFYKEALEKEIKEHGQTTDEYMKEILDTVSESYGDNFYMFASVDSVSQINDESIESFEGLLSDKFGTEVEIEDLYTLHYFEIARGRSNKTTLPREMLLVKTDGDFYLYSE
ncbi:MAG: hypothetical protein E7505_07335 [Ruminococcus sp.]|nr:hypothetical protein [Ruminococcus sp.]